MVTWIKGQTITHILQCTPFLFALNIICHSPAAGATPNDVLHVNGKRFFRRSIPRLPTTHTSPTASEALQSSKTKRGRFKSNLMNRRHRMSTKALIQSYLVFKSRFQDTNQNYTCFLVEIHTINLIKIPCDSLNNWNRHWNSDSRKSMNNLMSLNNCKW